MEAVASGSIAACEYLLLNGAKLDSVDVGGRRTALHHATILGHTGQVCQFLKRGTSRGGKASYSGGKGELCRKGKLCRYSA